MDVIIKDSSDKIVAQFDNEQKSKFGDFTNSLKIAKKPNLGKWTIEVVVDGVEKTKVFEVRDDSGVHMELNANKFVAYSTRIVELRLNIKSSDNSFSGIAKVSASGRQTGKNRELFNKLVKSVDVKSGQNVISIDLAYDMDLNVPNTDIDMKFVVDVIENQTKKTSTVTTDVKLMHKDSRVFEIIRDQNFRPGFEFPIKIRVKNFDGTLDQSYDNIIISIKSFRDDNSELPPDSFNKQVYDGEVNFKLSTNNEAKRIEMNLQFRQTVWIEKIKALASLHDEYMQLTANTSNKNIGDIIDFQAMTSAFEMETLHVMVIGPHGIVVNEDYSDAQGKDIFNFSLPITADMQPIANIIAYYIKGDGAIIYDGYTLETGSSIENSLKINTAMTAKPNDELEIQIISENDAKVFLAATSGDLDLNKIISTNIHKSIKFNDLSQYQFGQYNAFVLEPLTSDEKNDELIESKKDIEAVDQLFSDTWFFEDVDGREDVMLKKRIPNSSKTWHIFGFSMHPTNGFSLASTTPKITVNSDFIAKIHGPEQIRRGEIVKIEYNAINNLQKAVDANVTVTITNGKILNEKIRNNCYSFKESRRGSSSEKTDVLTIPAKSTSESKAIYIQPNDFKPIEVILQISTQGHSDVLRKTIAVALDSQTLTKSQTFTKNNDVLKNVMMSLDKTFATQMELDDDKIYKFTASIIKYKYLEKVSKNSSKIANILKEMKLEYQELLRILKNLTKPDAKSNLKLIAYIADALLDAREIITIDEKAIIDSLDYLARKQNYDGYFPYNSDVDSRRDIGSQGFQIQTQTALIILPFLKDQQLKTQYQSLVTKAIKKLTDSLSEASNDYEKVIIANALSQNGDRNVLTKFTLKHNYQISSFLKHKPMFVEIVSYLITLKSSDADNELKWLLNEMNMNNGFYSPYDAILATKALIKASDNIDLNKIRLNANNVSQTLPESFKVTPSIVKDSNDLIEMSIYAIYKTKNSKQIYTNLVVMEIELPSGYRYHSHETMTHIKQVESQNDGQNVIIYINKMEIGKNYLHKIYAEKVFDIYDAGDSTIKIYDYYRTNIRKEATLSHDSNKQNCKQQKEFDILEYS
ncbi:hypothetical protein ACKWTF_014088 [Chironomus riparius]